MKKRIASGMIAAALAIVPFTGTGIKSVDKVLTKNTAITADAAVMRGGLYYVTHSFVAYGPSGKKMITAGNYISVSTSGMALGVNVKWAYDQGYLSFIRS